MDPVPGTLLIAPPTLRDPNFRRTVVLLCEHGGEGSFGLILNRPLDLSLGEVLQEMEDDETPLALGGPVQPDTLHYLHAHGELVPKTIEIREGIFWGGDFELIKALLTSGEATLRDLRLFLGYAGWTDGQLEDEIEQGGWILAEADPASVFPEDPPGLWRTVLRRMGGEYAVLANFPDDPRMN